MRGLNQSLTHCPVFGVHRRGEGGGQHKAVAGVHRGMFLQPEVRSLIFDHPVGFEVPGELKRLAVFIPLTLKTGSGNKDRRLSENYSLLGALKIRPSMRVGFETTPTKSNSSLKEPPLLTGSTIILV
jgi:hypothetical protein